MKDLLFILWASHKFGGLERRYLRLANTLSKKNDVKVTIICQRRCFANALRYIDGGSLNIFYMETSALMDKVPYKLFRLFEIFWFLKFVKKSSATYIISCSRPGIFTALIAAASGPRKFFIAPNAALFSDLPLTFFDTFGINATLMQKPTIDHLSEEPANVLKYLSPKYFNKCKNRIAPVSFTDYSKVKNFETRDIDILMLARFVQGKGYELLEEIDSFLENFNVHCCGFGEMRVKIPSARVYQTDDPFAICARAKVFLSIQKSNNYPSQSLIEAMASGCAVIATDVGETHKLVTPDRGWLIPYDADKLTEAILHALQNPIQCEILGQRAQSFVSKNFTVEKYSNYFIDEVLDGCHQC